MVELDHPFSTGKPIEENWQAILDLERLVPCVEGGSVVDRTGPDSVKAQIKSAYNNNAWNGNGITSGVRTRFEFGDVHCYVTTGSVAGATNWIKGDLIEVSGIVKDVWFDTVELEQCAFRRGEKP